ncbi:MAG: hypothetical protein ACREOE_05630, partial [Gemmatimonadales bacterium]
MSTRNGRRQMTRLQAGDEWRYAPGHVSAGNGVLDAPIGARQGVRRVVQALPDARPSSTPSP